MKGCRRWIAGLIVFAGMVMPSVANAADCTLTGSGLETSATDLSTYQPATGTLKASMIFVDFSDHAFDPAEDPPDYPGNLPNPPGIGHSIVDWASNYFGTVSGGRLSLDVKMDDHWVRMPHPASSYSFQTFPGQKAFIQDAVTAADPTFDFSGRQTIYVVSAATGPYTGGGPLPNSPAFIGPDSFGVNTNDGVTIHWGASFGDDVRRPSPDYGAHILAHETSHTFGLPDLYSFGQDFDHQHLNVGAWDRMGWIGPGFGYSGWHSLKLGWLDPSQAVCVDGDATATLTPMSNPGGTKMLISKTDSHTAYVAEVRSSTGVDTGICNEGVLVYKVDANANTGGAHGAGPIDVELSDPNNPGDPTDQLCGAISNAPFGVDQSFTEGPVTVQVLSGDPATGYTVRMTGVVHSVPPDPTPDPTPNPTPNPDPTPTPQTGGIEAKLELNGKRKAVASLTCPAAASACTGKLTLKGRGGLGALGESKYSVAPPGGELTVKIAKSARKTLKNLIRKKGKAKATATLDGPTGTVRQKVKLS
jgi:M6 family metalloprotease-like protein